MPSLFHEEDHPRGQPENAGQFAPKNSVQSSQATVRSPIPQVGGPDWPMGNDEKTPVSQADVEESVRNPHKLDQLRRSLIWPSSVAKLNRIVNPDKASAAEKSGIAIPRTPRDAKALAQLVRRVAVDQFGKNLRHKCAYVAEGLYLAFEPHSEIWSGIYPTTDEHGGYHVVTKIGDYVYDVTADQFGGPKIVVLDAKKMDGDAVYGSFQRNVISEHLAKQTGSDGMGYAGRLYKETKPGSPLIAESTVSTRGDANPTMTPAPSTPQWQPKLFDAEPTGQKTFFDAGIEKDHGKPKKKAAAPLAGPSLVEQIEAELSKQSKANKPLPQQKGMFSRARGSRTDVERYRQPWDESKHPRDALGRFSESHAQSHVASGNAFRQWVSQHAVPALKERGYGDVEAQQIAFKVAQRVHRREKGEPVESAVKDAVDLLNHWADKKGPAVPAQPTVSDKSVTQEELLSDEPVTLPVDDLPPKRNIMQEMGAFLRKKSQPEQQATSEIPEAPEWFNRLKESLEQRKANIPEEDSPAASETSGDADSTDDIHFKEWIPDDGPEQAPPPQPAQMPRAIEPLTALQQLPNGNLVGATQMNVRDLHTDPKRFQYKFIGVGEGGVTKELKDSKRFNPMLGGQLLVWRDPDDGKTYVINGHHRFDLAQRSLASGDDHPDWDGRLSVYFIDADTPATARALGAITNIAEGRGTVVDAAKFLRDTNADLAELEKHGVSVRGAMARDAIPLSKLSDRLWQKVAQETMTPSRGLAIAKHLGGDTDAQDQLASIIDKREEKTGKDIPDSHVEEMAREMSMTPKHQEGGGGLFGDFFERSLLPERASLKSAVRRAIAAEQNAFQAVSSTRRAGTLQSEGKNTLDTEGNRERAKQSARQLEDFEQQSNWAGHPIAAAVNEAAQRLANEPRKAKSIEKQLVEQVRGILAGGQPVNGGDQLGSGRPAVADADSTGSRDGEPERNSRRSQTRKLLAALFERAFNSVSRYSAGWDESKHPRGQPKNAGQFVAKTGSAMPRYVVRRTPNPESDLKRGWSAWGGQYEKSPLDLADVDNAMSARNMDIYDPINAIDDEHTVETDDGWEIRDTPEAWDAVAEWIKDELDIDVVKDPATGLYAIRHHDGLSSYEIMASEFQKAFDEAASSKHNWLTGGVRGIQPKKFWKVNRPDADDVYLFEVGDIGMQADS